MRAARRGSDGSYILAGTFPVHDLADLGIDLREGDYATIAGLMLEHLDGIPESGEHIDIAGCRLQALDV